MMRRKITTLAVVALTAVGLSACADPYAYGRAPGYGYADVGWGAGYSSWDVYYGDPFGWRHVPMGWAGSGFGWYGGYYYPGTGGFVYDRRGVRRAWAGQQQRYWQPRIALRQQGGYRDPRPPRYTGQQQAGQPVIGGAIAGSIARDRWQGGDAARPPRREGEVVVPNAAPRQRWSPERQAMPQQGGEQPVQMRERRQQLQQGQERRQERAGSARPGQRGGSKADGERRGSRDRAR